MFMIIIHRMVRIKRLVMLVLLFVTNIGKGRETSYAPCFVILKRTVI